MPSTTKILLFTSSAFVTLISVGMMGYGMSTQWAKTTLDCARGESSFYNGTAIITLTLFTGIMNRSFCPVYGRIDDFQGNFPRLSKGALHYKIFTHTHISRI